MCRNLSHLRGSHATYHSSKGWLFSPNFWPLNSGPSCTWKRKKRYEGILGIPEITIQLPEVTESCTNGTKNAGPGNSIGKAIGIEANGEGDEGAGNDKDVSIDVLDEFGDGGPNYNGGIAGLAVEQNDGTESGLALHAPLEVETGLLEVAHVIYNSVASITNTGPVEFLVPLYATTTRVYQHLYIPDGRVFFYTESNQT